MNLFDLSGSDLTIHVDALAIPEFEEIWNTREDKHDAVNIIKYVILNNYPLSPYVRSYLENDRKEMLSNKFLRGVLYTEEELKNAELAFISLYDTLSIKSLRYMRATLDRLITEELMGSKISIKDAVDLQPKLEKAIESIKKLEETVKLELAGKSKIKGGYKLGILEQASGVKK